MATTIRLDGSAVSKLLTETPEFKLELQRAIVAEVIRGMYRNDLPAAMLKIIDGQFEKERVVLVEALREENNVIAFITKAFDNLTTKTKDYWGKATTSGLSAELKKRIEDEVDRKVSTVLNTAIKINAESITALLGATIDERIEKRVNFLINDEINKRVIAKIQVAIGKL